MKNTFIPELKAELKNNPNLRLSKVVYYGSGAASAKLVSSNSKRLAWVIYDMAGYRRLMLGLGG